MLMIQPIFYATTKIFTNYLEIEIIFCIFVVKLRILLPFHYYKFEGSRLKSSGRPPLAVQLDGFSHPTG